MSVSVIQTLNRPDEVPQISTPPVESVVPVSVAGQAGWGLAVSASSVERVTGGTTTEDVTRLDRIEDVTSSATTVLDFQISATRTGNQSDAITFESLRTSVATVDSGGKATWVSAGRAKINVKHGPITIPVSIAMASPSNTQENRTYAGAVAGSAREAATEGVDGLIAGKSAATAMRVFTTQNHTGSSYTRNTSCWAHGLAGMTGISPWNSSGANHLAGTAITPRHIIFAKHYQIGTGATVRFVTDGDVVHNRTMVAKADIAGSDFTIGQLSSDLPGTIAPVKVLPADWEDYFPTGLEHIPALGLDQEEKALVADSGGSNGVMQVPSDPKRLEFHEPIIGGDSGNPAFLVIDGEIVLLTTWTFGGAGAGSFIPSFRTAIQTAINSLGSTGYTLTDVDLTSFTDFSE